jgi:hypothetical protein
MMNSLFCSSYKDTRVTIALRNSQPIHGMTLEIVPDPTLATLRIHHHPSKHGRAYTPSQGLKCLFGI